MTPAELDELFAVSVDDLEQRIDDGERRAKEQSAELWKLSVSVPMLRKLIATAREAEALREERDRLRDCLLQAIEFVEVVGSRTDQVQIDLVKTWTKAARKDPDDG